MNQERIEFLRELSHHNFNSWKFIDGSLKYPIDPSWVKWANELEEIRLSDGLFPPELLTDFFKDGWEVYEDDDSTKHWAGFAAELICVVKPKIFPKNLRIIKFMNNAGRFVALDYFDGQKWGQVFARRAESHYPDYHKKRGRHENFYYWDILDQLFDGYKCAVMKWAIGVK